MDMQKTGVFFLFLYEKNDGMRDFRQACLLFRVCSLPVTSKFLTCWKFASYPFEANDRFNEG